MTSRPWRAASLAEDSEAGWPGMTERAGPLTLAQIDAETGEVRLLPVE